MDAASEYRQRAVESASPVGLVVLLYGGAVTALLRAIAAVETNNIEKRVSELNKVFAIISQLQGTLDFEKGGAVSVQLDKFYRVMRAQALEASVKNSKPILEELVKHMTLLKDAWRQVELDVFDKGITGIGHLPSVVSSSHYTPATQTL